MHPALALTSHRSWPLPFEPWIMTQTWHDLLFAHWPLKPASLRPLLPEKLPLDLFQGEAWVGVVPFHMSGIRARRTPPLPGLSAFPELNVRTYVTIHDKPGVFFFSLDAASRAAVWAARQFYHLPYFHAEMMAKPNGNSISYSSRRKTGDAEFRSSYGPTGPVQLSQPDSLDHWLTERYCLYTVHAGKVYRAEIHHAPWPLQPAQAEITRNSVAQAAGITLPGIAPLLHFARRLDVLIWRISTLD